MLHNHGFYVIFPMNYTWKSWRNQSGMETAGLSDGKKNLNYYFKYVTVYLNMKKKFFISSLLLPDIIRKISHFSILYWRQ